MKYTISLIKLKRFFGIFMDDICGKGRAMWDKLLKIQCKNKSWWKYWSKKRKKKYYHVHKRSFSEPVILKVDKKNTKI